VCSVDFEHGACFAEGGMSVEKSLVVFLEKRESCLVPPCRVLVGN
jgi:hypothetical protein